MNNLKTIDFLTIKEVAKITGFSYSMAGEIIRKLNNELKHKGYLTFKGRVLTSYFAARVGEDVKKEGLP